MVIAKIEQSYLSDTIDDCLHEILYPDVLALFKNGADVEIVDVLNRQNFNQLLNIETFKEYDDWYDDQVNEFHRSLFPLYKDDVLIEKSNPYTYSAHILNHSFKLVVLSTNLIFNDFEQFVVMLHPILSNDFLEMIADLEIQELNKIQGREQYYSIVNQYRQLLGGHVSEKNKWVLELDFGKTV